LVAQGNAFRPPAFGNGTGHPASRNDLTDSISPRSDANASAIIPPAPRFDQSAGRCQPADVANVSLPGPEQREQIRWRYVCTAQFVLADSSIEHDVRQLARSLHRYLVRQRKPVRTKSGYIAASF
jgi:hypothetical protein